MEVRLGILASLQALDAQATPGPWEVAAGGYLSAPHHDAHDRLLMHADIEDGGRFDKEADAYLVAEMRNALPELLERFRVVPPTVLADAKAKVNSLDPACHNMANWILGLPLPSRLPR